MQLEWNDPDMTRKELIESIVAAAEPVYGAREAGAIARLVAEKRYGLSRAETALEPDAELPSLPAYCFSSKAGICKACDEAERGVYCGVNDEFGDERNAADACFSWKTDLADIAAARPVQYILGVADFDGMELAVGEGVLIPRPETEELVRWISEDALVASRTKYEVTTGREVTTRVLPLRVLDMGTGSGAIAIALAKNLPQARVTGIDISPDALEYARRNNEIHAAGVTLLEKDILTLSLPKNTPGAHGDGRYPVNELSHTCDSRFEGVLFDSVLFDVIVSNPPYIPAAERTAMARNVTEYEPATALFVPDDDPLLFYRAIARFAGYRLTDGGTLYFEIHEAMGGTICEMLAAEGFTNIEIRKDINSKPRMVKCRR